jgi:hypothetical protein
VILIRNAGSRKDFDVALASSDADVPAPELIARYDSRWTKVESFQAFPS